MFRAANGVEQRYGMPSSRKRAAQLAGRLAGRPHPPELHHLQLLALDVRHGAQKSFNRNVTSGLFHHLATGAGQSIFTRLKLAFRQHPRLVLSQPDNCNQRLGAFAYHDAARGKNRRAEFRRFFHTSTAPHHLEQACTQNLRQDPFPRYCPKRSRINRLEQRTLQPLDNPFGPLLCRPLAVRFALRASSRSRLIAIASRNRAAAVTQCPTRV
jgi:hypothetical protein